MSLQREHLYKYPWSKTDNPGAWVEVTDECDMVCPGCYRHKLEGHKPLEDVKREILFSRNMTNCERIAIAGGEPLIYPHIGEVVNFIARNNMKPMILTNGVKFDRTVATELKRAGLAQVYFHVDSGQKRPGWDGKSEKEMNALRQHYADLVFGLGGVQCGFNITVFRSTVKDISDIVKWSRANIHKVQFLSLICFRGLLDAEGIEYMVNGQPLDRTQLQTLINDPDEITLSTEEMYDLLEDKFPDLRASAYLGGTAVPATYKFLILLPIGSKKKIYGVIGARTAELVQSSYHLIKGRYNASLKSPQIGRKVFLLSLLDRDIRRAFVKFIGACAKNPIRFFDKIYVQCINLQQPNETINGEKNLCDGCMNMMAYDGKMINSCALDEYRMFGGPIQQVTRKTKEV
jgi:organic radical activating enzyme